jgi:hypothetical protein
MDREVDVLSTPANRIIGDDTVETMPTAMSLQTSHSLPHGSPFQVKAEDVESLNQSGGFAILREHLAEYYNYEYDFIISIISDMDTNNSSSFCEHHDDPSLASQYILNRDILHALLVPVIELFDKAESTACHYTRSMNPADHEYAYTASARAAYLWLQCFLDRERDWSYTRGCPGCVVAHTLESEFTIRLLYAACLLSDVHYPFTLDGPTLPSFIFYLSSLKSALAADSLWGEDYFELVAPKAAMTRNGIEDLIHQCLELDAILSVPTTPATDEALSAATSPRISPVLAPMGGTPGMKVKRSKMAKHQMRLKLEEEKWVEEMMKCMNSLQMASSDAACSESGEPTVLNLDAITKSGSVVNVNQIVPID